ncbi:thermonuclease family protein [Reyranella soli]|uniref:thermonuclease family protein n=1 Tax=Reyranella soli TaxID=1230389 RepID=UPI0014796A6C
MLRLALLRPSLTATHSSQGGVTYRPWGIDAPELAQTCPDGWPAGRMAATRLQALTAGRSVVCQEKDHDRYGRTVAICRVGGRTTWTKRPQRRQIDSACMPTIASRRGSGRCAGAMFSMYGPLRDACPYLKPATPQPAAIADRLRRAAGGQHRDTRRRGRDR